MQIWRFVISQFAYGSAALHKAVAKYLRGGHATTMPTFVLDPSKDSATWPILAESTLGKKILESATRKPRTVIQLHNISLEVCSGREGWAIPFEGLTDEEHEEWSKQHVPFYLQGLVFLRKCSKRLYALNNRMSPDAGQSHVELLTKNEQSAVLVEKEVFKATRKFREQNPNKFDPEAGWVGMLPHLALGDGYNATSDLNREAFASIAFREGIWGPPDDPIFAERMDSVRIQNFVFKKQLPKMISLAGKGEVFDMTFPDVSEFGSKAPFPAPIWQAKGRGAWKFLDKQSLLRLSATSTQRNKFYLFSKSSAGRVYFAPDPGMRALVNEIMSIYREASVCPILQFKDRVLSEKKLMTLNELRNEPYTRTHEEWHERAHDDRPIAHCLMHFSQAHGAGSVLFAAAFDCSPTRALEFAYGDNYLHSAFFHMVDCRWIILIMAVDEAEKGNEEKAREFFSESQSETESERAVKELLQQPGLNEQSPFVKMAKRSSKDFLFFNEKAFAEHYDFVVKRARSFREVAGRRLPVRTFAEAKTAIMEDQLSTDVSTHPLRAALLKCEDVRYTAKALCCWDGVARDVHVTQDSGKRAMLMHLLLHDEEPFDNQGKPKNASIKSAMDALKVVFASGFHRPLEWTYPIWGQIIINQEMEQSLKFTLSTRPVFTIDQERWRWIPWSYPPSLQI